MTIDEITAEMLNRAVAQACERYRDADSSRLDFVNRVGRSQEVAEYATMLVNSLPMRMPTFELFAAACAVMLTSLSIGIEVGLSVSEQEKAKPCH